MTATRPTNLDDAHVHYIPSRELGARRVLLCDDTRAFGALWEDSAGSHITRAGSGDRETNFRFTRIQHHTTCPKCCLLLGWSPEDIGEDGPIWTPAAELCAHCDPRPLRLAKARFCAKCGLRLPPQPTDLLDRSNMDGLEEVAESVQRARRALGSGHLPLGGDRQYLLAYIDRLEANATRAEKDSDEASATRERLSELLTGVANALKGPPPELTLWSWHDVPQLAEKAVEVVKAAKEQNRCDCGTRVAVLSDGTCEVCLTVDSFEKSVRPDED